MPSGSRPLTGSSSSSTPGSPSSAAAMPSRWPMPSENFPARRPRGLGQPDDAEHLVHPATAGSPLLAASARQVAAGAAARVERPGLQQRAHLAQRPAQLAVAAPADPGLPGIRPVQAEDHPHGGGLARAVRPEEAGHHARPHVEAERVDRDRGSVALGEPATSIMSYLRSRSEGHATAHSGPRERGYHPSLDRGFSPASFRPRSGNRRGSRSLAFSAGPSNGEEPA